MNPWIETYRGTVNRWELDNVDHFTVAYYFDRFADATANALEALHLGPAILGRAPQRTGGGALRAVTADCYVRYLHELRAGDILHILSGVIAVDRTASSSATSSSIQTATASVPPWSSACA